MKQLELEGAQKKRYKPLGSDSGHDFVIDLLWSIFGL